MYRIMQVGSSFRPQRKVPILGWITLAEDGYDGDTVPIYCSTLEDAKKVIREYEQDKVVKYHPYP